MATDPNIKARLLKNIAANRAAVRASKFDQWAARTSSSSTAVAPYVSPPNIKARLLRNIAANRAAVRASKFDQWAARTSSVSASNPPSPPPPRILGWIQNRFERRREQRQPKATRYRIESSYRYGFGRAIGETHARVISGFLAWFFRKLPIVALIGLIIFGFFYYTNADLRASMQERFSYGLEKLHLDKTFAPLIKYLNPSYIAKSAAGIGDFQTRPDYVAQEMQGVIVDRFDGEDGYVGAPLFFEGELTVDSFPKEDVTLAFECLLRDKDVTVRQGIVNIGGEPEGTPTLFLPQGKKDQKVFVTCQFDPIEDVAGAFKDYRAVLIWKYQDISTKTILRAYTQERATQVSLKSKGIDPLESIRDTTYVDEEGYAIPLCVQHCGLVDLSVALQSPLPLAEDGVHYLTIKLFSQTAWSGTIQRMNALTLVLPDGLTFGDQGCFFVGKKEKLSVDDHKLHLTEQDPSVVSFNEHLIAKKPDDFEFKCDIDVHATTDEQPSPQTIQSVAMYDYGGEETTLFKVYGVEA